ASALARACAATTPLAPGLFSTTTGWPRLLVSPWATTRATVSGSPPAAYGTMNRIGRDGNVSAESAACAQYGAARPIATPSMVDRAIRKPRRDDTCGLLCIVSLLLSWHVLLDCLGCVRWDRNQRYVDVP